jgi:hypothetical protein
MPTRIRNPGLYDGQRIEAALDLQVRVSAQVAHTKVEPEIRIAMIDQTSASDS